MNEKLDLIKENGTTIQADVICYIEDLTNGKRYMYYTLNEIIGNGPGSTVKIYVGKMKQNDALLDEKITEEEWKKLTDNMREVLKGTPNLNIKYLPIGEIADKSVVSERVIAMPLSYDYISKQRGVYAEAIATAPVEVPVEEPAITEAPIVEPTVNPFEEVASEEPAPVETPTEEVIPVEPVVEPVVDEPKEEVTEPIEEPANRAALEPINVQEIEAKYAKMIEDLNELKDREIEAANRYNDTIKLSAMHNEQHASYVASEQTKEADIVPEQVAPSIEPTPVTPIIPEPVQTENAPETNWFDMPIE